MIQYPKLESVTLPSVSDWYTNTNIIRDPPRSLTTRRIDRVGQTDYITELLDESTERSCDFITQYARGVNPMVSVSYDNNGNNSGTPANMAASIQQTKLPYRIMDQGAFRPPILSQYELFPLSRLPRLATQALTKPGFVDFSKSKFLPTKFRMVKDILNKYEVTANKTRGGEGTPGIQENYKMEAVVNDKHINVEANSGMKSETILSDYTKENYDRYKSINENIIEAWAETNPSKNISWGLDEIEFNTNKYINKYTTPIDARTNLSVKNTQCLENINMDTANNIQNVLQYETNSGVNPGYTLIGEMGEIELERNFPIYNIDSAISDSRVNKTILHENELHFERNLPQVTYTAPIKKQEQFDNENNSRNYNLRPSLQKGGFDGGGVKPKVYIHDQNVQKVLPQSQKDRIRSSVNSIGNRENLSTKVQPQENFFTQNMKERINGMQFNRDTY